MILKKSKLLAVSLLLALVEYLCRDGRRKWMGLLSRWEATPYGGSDVGSDVGLGQTGGGEAAHIFALKSALQFANGYEEVRQKGRSERSGRSGRSERRERRERVNPVCILPSDMPRFRTLHEKVEVEEELLLQEKTADDMNVSGDADNTNNKDEYGQPLIKGQTATEGVLPQQTVATKVSPLIEKSTIDHYLDVCTQIRKKTFSFKNCDIFYESPEVTLYKNILEDKSETRYDLIGYGTLNDVSLYGASQALNNLDVIKEWNKNIYKINYLKLNKASILEKYENDEKIDATKYILEKEHLRENRRYIYLINGLPWPFRSHDTVYEFYQKYIENQNMLLVANKSVNEVFSDNSYYTRIRDYENFFCIYPKSKNSYEKGLDYVISVYYDVNIPKFIRNNILSQIFPSLIFNLHEVSKTITEKGLAMSSDDIKKNELPFQLKDNFSPGEGGAGQDGKEGQDGKSPFFGATVLRVIFVDPFHFIWTTNVNFFKKIFVIVTSIF
ncbi:StAR-related lipid transfer protein, putative [Plasmodium vivax]|nr:StAR-related lipid transfer protein, putative [Plasmodium vivax]